MWRVKHTRNFVNLVSLVNLQLISDETLIAASAGVTTFLWYGSSSVWMLAFSWCVANSMLKVGYRSAGLSNLSYRYLTDNTNAAVASTTSRSNVWCIISIYLIYFRVNCLDGRLWFVRDYRHWLSAQQPC